MFEDRHNNQEKKEKHKKANNFFSLWHFNFSYQCKVVVVLLVLFSTCTAISDVFFWITDIMIALLPQFFFVRELSI